MSLTSRRSQPRLLLSVNRERLLRVRSSVRGGSALDVRPHARANHQEDMMPSADEVICAQISGLTKLFSSHVQDRSTWDELENLTNGKGSLHSARDHVNRILKKDLDASKSGGAIDSRVDCQYAFELACARTLNNIGEIREIDWEPFSIDSPYWVIPQALTLARKLGIDEKEVTDIAVYPWA
jgi:hypothetical protein